MTKEALIKLFEDEHGKRYDTADDAPEAFTNWLIERLAKKDSEIEAWQAKSNRQKRELIKARLEIQSLRSKMDKAQKVWVETEDLGITDMKMFMCYESEKWARADECDNPIQVLLMEVEEK